MADTDTTPQTANGAGPKPADDCAPCAEGLTLRIPQGGAIGERALGLLGLGVGLVLAFMGLDLLLGGALSRPLLGAELDNGNRGAS